MFTTGANDVWPSHPVDFNVKSLKAPFGAQPDWMYGDDWGVYMACGNAGDEGESGRTLNTLMTSPTIAGYAGIALSASSTNDRVIINDLTVTLTLKTTHGANEDTTLKLAWDSTFVPTQVVVGSGDPCSL